MADHDATFAVETFADYRRVERPAELLKPGNRVWLLPPEELIGADGPRVLAGEPQKQIADRVRDVQLRVAKVDAALCLGRGIIIDVNSGRLLPDYFRKAGVGLAPAATATIGELPFAEPGVTDWRDILGSAALLEVDRAYYGASAHNGFGHILLEAMSRFWAYDAMAEAGVRSVVTNKAGNGHYASWLEALGADRRDVHPIRRAPILVRDLVVPSQSYILDRGSSERYGRVAQRMGVASGAEALSGARVYVSRRLAGKRRLIDEEAVEALFASQGFTIFRPEEHPVAEQTRVAAGASFIAGPVGSALYSSVFAGRGATKLVLAPDHFFTPNDSALAKLCGHELWHVFGRSSARSEAEALHADWQLDHGTLERALERLERADAG